MTTIDDQPQDPDNAPTQPAEAAALPVAPVAAPAPMSAVKTRYDGVAMLCGAATLPAFRRRGIQSLLYRWRLAIARAAGCDVAVVTTQPGSKSQANAIRQGFSVLYTRAILIWPL